MTRKANGVSGNDGVILGDADLRQVQVPRRGAIEMFDLDEESGTTPAPGGRTFGFDLDHRSGASSIDLHAGGHADVHRGGAVMGAARTCRWVPLGAPDFEGADERRRNCTGFSGGRYRFVIDLCTGDMRRRRKSEEGDENHDVWRAIA